MGLEIYTYRELLSAEPDRPNPLFLPRPSRARSWYIRASDTGLASNRVGTAALISPKRVSQKRRLVHGWCAHPCPVLCRCVFADPGSRYRPFWPLGDLFIVRVLPVQTAFLDRLRRRRRRRRPSFPSPLQAPPRPPASWCEPTPRREDRAPPTHAQSRTHASCRRRSRRIR